MKIVRKSNAQATSYNDLPGQSATQSENLADRRLYPQQPVTDVIRTRHADFTSMTHRELREWLNGEMYSGQMTLEQSTPFMWLSMNKERGSEYLIHNAKDNERVDFIQKAREGLEGAEEQDNAFVVEMFQMAIDIMEQHQGQTIGVDTCA